MPAQAFIVGAFEHPTRLATGMSLAQLHAEVAAGALRDAGLAISDVDMYCCAGDAPGFGPLSMADYLGLQCRQFDSSEAGGASYLSHVAHAAAAISLGRAHVALVTQAGTPRSGGPPPGASGGGSPGPEAEFENLWGASVAGYYAMAAQRHMHEFGLTGAQLAEVKVAASMHAQHNPNAVLRDAVTIEEVLASPMVADPLHRLDCCVITDGGGAVVLVSPQVQRTLQRAGVSLLGAGEAIKHSNAGRPDLTHTAAVWSGPAAFVEAGITPADVDYASIYDSFTITVVQALEDLGFCERGRGGEFVADGGLLAPHGRLPFNTDGGGLCNNHSGNRGGMTKIVEAVRQLRGEAHPAVQVSDCRLALVHATGGALATRSASATLILGRQDGA